MIKRVAPSLTNLGPALKINHLTTPLIEYQEVSNALLVPLNLLEHSTQLIK
jgi:hypothetical protein